ncbi:MAG TPA: uracil-DNA glycosylase family protein [Prolixibacteraceae bacterium]|nr:uracil-DNA glycosylase family protein [Prolixibacteraceae bacterium]
MRNIVEDYFEFYETFKEKYSEILKIKNVGILSEFLDNKNNIIEFHKKYVQPNSPKIVMCGINPGRRGAGITGIPFIDTNSLSKMLPDISNPKTEKSAKFFFSIIEEFGINGFYRNVHVTNMSWFGFYELDKGTNINYNSLPTEIQNDLIDKFVEEMDFINPNVIIPIGDIVNWELLYNLKVKNRLNAEIGPRLYHPAYRLVDRKTYIETLTKYLTK